MTKEEAIKEIEKLQIDIKDDNKITLIKIHFSNDYPKEDIIILCKRFQKLLESKFPDYKNYILVPERDGEYDVSIMEITKDSKIEI